jgi:hypothetical protein
VINFTTTANSYLHNLGEEELKRGQLAKLLEKVAMTAERQALDALLALSAHELPGGEKPHPALADVALNARIITVWNVIEARFGAAPGEDTRER